MLHELIDSAQRGDQQAMEALIIQFHPLLLKYAKRLGSEDDYQDMALSFMNLIQHFKLKALNNQTEGAIVSYISKSMYHQYVTLLKDKIRLDKNETSLETLDFRQQQFASFWIDEPDSDLLQSSILTSQERKILYLIYYAGYTSTEIAKTMKSSRQNINQIKNRALKKLKTRFQPDSH